MPWRTVLPTSSMSAVRMHFCTDTARGAGGVCSPRKYGMNGTMPATVNSSEGSGETREAEGTARWPRCSK